MVTPKTIAVIGAGTMGQGIAQTCVLSGYTVLIYDIQPQLLSASVSKTEKNLQFLVDKGKINRK